MRQENEKGQDDKQVKEKKKKRGLKEKTIQGIRKSEEKGMEIKVK